MRVSHGTYRGVIAIFTIAGTFLLAAANLILYGHMEVDAWVIGLTSTIVAFYFGERAAVVASRNGVTNGGSSSTTYSPERYEADAATIRESDKQ